MCGEKGTWRLELGEMEATAAVLEKSEKSMKHTILWGNTYPKHVWSPAGGWYSQPANWKGNTAIMSGVVLAITASAWVLSANLEHRDRFPERGRFYPSR
ncbi:hypothetical protein ANO11243_024120 [Dothideomycetidae sp. 11243]|nr:hypothetical protein ANO11243_024120 [fungal sp. No.11243]